MSSRSLFCLIVFVLTLSSCATKDYQSFIHTQNWPSQPSAGPRQLVVFMDGTGNDVTSRTNVRRLYEMTVSLHRLEVIAYYDPGVGTGRRLTYRILGGAVGTSISCMASGRRLLTEFSQGSRRFCSPEGTAGCTALIRWATETDNPGCCGSST